MLSKKKNVIILVTLNNIQLTANIEFKKIFFFNYNYVLLFISKKKKKSLPSFLKIEVPWW